jgi:4-amino-4-deoxy-L-arabinose transferase-like glycosyltransferase
MALIRKGNAKEYFHWGILLLCIAVALLRAFVFLQGRGFFFDESNLLRNIHDLSFIQLLGKLDHDQYAPPLYLWDLKFWSLLGINEYTMRITSLLAGIGSVYLIYEWGKRNFTSWGLVYLIGMLGASFLMIRYSTEVKQYSVDVFFTLLLIYLALEAEEVKSWGRLYAVAVVSILSAMPSVFVIFGIGLYLMALPGSRKKGIVLSFLSFFVFGIYYIFVLREATASSQLQIYHERYFLSLDWEANRRIILGFFSNIFGKTFFPLLPALLLVIWASYRIYNRKKELLLLLWGPFFALSFASALHQYSFIPRMTLFIYPLFWFMVAYALEDIFFGSRAHSQRLQLSFVSLLFIGFSMWVVSPFSSDNWPMKYEEVGSALSKVSLDDAEVLVMSTGAVPGFDVYNRIHSSAEHSSIKYIVKPYHQIHFTVDSLLRFHESVYVLDAHTFGRDAKTLSDNIEKSRHPVVWSIEDVKAKMWKLERLQE